MDISPSEVRNASEMATTKPNTEGPRFFSQAQVHVAESARYASGAMITPSQNVRTRSYGMDQQTPPERATDSWSRQMVCHFALIGKSQEGAAPSATQIDTGVPAAESLTMGPRHALEHRRLNPLTPYRKEVWAEQLAKLGLEGRYPCLVQGLAEGFNLGIPRIRNTYIPPNHPSLIPLTNVYNQIVNSEFTAGHYIGLFTHAQLKRALGPFQSSPLSLVPKKSSQGSYQAVHNFSHPHNPSPNATSINSHIDGDDFPCTRGTFSMVALLIAQLPPGSQASIHDIADAYRMIPVLPAQWPGLVIHLQVEGQFAVNICNNFGLTSGGRVYGMLADAGAEIFRGHGMGPIAKWVDDHLFF